MDRWDFLIPWCEAVDFGYAGYVSLEKEDTAWDVRDCRLRVILPSRSETYGRQEENSDEQEKEAFCRRVQRMCEGLALLATAVYFDKSSLRYLLEKRYGNIVGQSGEERYEKHIPARFLLVFALESQSSPYEQLEYILLSLFGDYQSAQPSTEYLDTLTKIATMFNSPRLQPEGVMVRIPVKMLVEKANLDGNTHLALKAISQTQEMIREQWKSSEQHPSPGLIRCIFVMEPMVADLGSLETKTVSELLRVNVPLSQVSFRLGEIRNLWMEKVKQRSCTGQFVSTIFNRNVDISAANCLNQLQTTSEVSSGIVDVWLGKFVLDCEIEALFSALTVSQTVRKVKLHFNQMEMDKHIRYLLWKWIGYSVFSERALLYSTVESVAINCVNQFEYKDAIEFSRMLTSNHPEEELYGLPHGKVEERNVVLRTNAPIRAVIYENGKPVANENSLTSTTSSNFVRTMSDDGESPWVNVLAPGYGYCQVQRNDLEFYNDIVVSRKKKYLALTFNFEEKNSDDLERLPQFLESIGPILKSITLGIGSMALDQEEILKYCPNLLDLTLCGNIVEMYLDFREFRKEYQWPPGLLNNWQDIPILCEILCKSEYFITMCTQRLRILQNKVPQLRFQDDENTVWKSLQLMLEKNRILEYLEVRMPSNCHYNFTKYHLQPLDENPQLLLESKLAFLNVLLVRNVSMENTSKLEKKRQKSQSTRNLYLDQFVIVKIFTFAAEWRLRKVFCSFT